MTDWLAELDQIEPEVASMTNRERDAIREWLNYIEETDSPTISAILSKCENVLDARQYFLERSREVRRG